MKEWYCSFNIHLFCTARKKFLCGKGKQKFPLLIQFQILTLVSTAPCGGSGQNINGKEQMEEGCGILYLVCLSVIHYVAHYVYIYWFTMSTSIGSLCVHLLVHYVYIYWFTMCTSIGSLCVPPCTLKGYAY